jgi:4-aminobutyrate aminotransferase-like enzyme
MTITPVFAINETSSGDDERRSYAQYVNPIWVRLLDALGMNVHYTHCSDAELYTQDGRKILDCLSGYCVHNIGHNHPHVVSELVAELQSQSTVMIQSTVVMRLFKDREILMQICGNNFMVLKVAPPLTVNEAQLNYCVESIPSVLETIHSSSVFWLDALKLGRRTMSLS